MKRWLGSGHTSIDAVAFTELGWQSVKLAEIHDQGKMSAPPRKQATTGISYRRKGRPVIGEAQKYVAPQIANLQLNVIRHPDKAHIQKVSSQPFSAMRSSLH